MPVDVLRPTFSAHVSGRCVRRWWWCVCSACCHTHLDDRRTCIGEVTQRGFLSGDGAVCTQWIDPGGWNETDALASERIRVEHCSPIFRTPCAGGRRDGIVWVGSCNDCKHVCEIFNRTGHGAAEIREPDERHHAASTFQPVCTAQCDETRGARRPVQRITGLRSQCGCGQTRGDGTAGAAAGSDRGT